MSKSMSYKFTAEDAKLPQVIWEPNCAQIANILTYTEG